MFLLSVEGGSRKTVRTLHSNKKKHTVQGKSVKHFRYMSKDPTALETDT